jgi:hypothetical protein
MLAKQERVSAVPLLAISKRSKGTEGGVDEPGIMLIRIKKEPAKMLYFPFSVKTGKQKRVPGVATL